MWPRYAVWPGYANMHCNLYIDKCGPAKFVLGGISFPCFLAGPSITQLGYAAAAKLSIASGLYWGNTRPSGAPSHWHGMQHIFQTVQPSNWAQWAVGLHGCHCQAQWVTHDCAAAEQSSWDALLWISGPEWPPASPLAASIPNAAPRVFHYCLHWVCHSHGDASPCKK